MNMQISADGIDRIMAREGVRLMTYPDTRGIPTIGVGHDGSTGAPKPVWGMETVSYTHLTLPTNREV